MRIALLLLLATVAAAEPLAFKGAKIYPVSGPPIERGVLLVDGGRIVAVGADAAIPANATVRDASGLVIIPGLVDTHSHLGVYSRPSVIANADGNESTDPVQGIVRAIDSLFPADPGFRLARAGGITVANVMPGSGNVMGGQTAYVKLRGKTVEQMLIDLTGGPPGMKMANGENPKRNWGSRDKSPATRMKVTAMQREIFLKAIAYREKLRRWEEKKEGDRPPRDIALEPVVEILEGKRTVHFHTHRADDIMSALRLKDEFGFEVVLHHVTEAYLVAGEIASRGVACSFTLVDSPGGKPEAMNLRYENPALAAAAGIKIAFNTDDPVTESRFFLRTAALAVRGGLDPAVALAGLTLRPAEMMHIEKRVGSLEAGKDADFVLLSGEPFSTYTKVIETWIDGEKVFDRSRMEDYRYSTGGFHVRDRMPTSPYPTSGGPGGAHVATEIPAEAEHFAVRAGILFTGSGAPVRDGVLLVEKGVITRVGGTVPEGWPVARAAFVTPGLIDAHGSAGLSGAMNVPADQDLEESAAPNQASLRAIDGFNPREPLLRYLLAHGVTMIHAVPGPGNPIAGQAGLFRTHDGSVVRSPTAFVFNLGESPKEERGTRMGTAALIRKALAPGKPPKDEPDIDRDALKPLLDGSVPALFVAHREDDLMTALRIAREFNLRVILSQATEGFLVREELKAAAIPVVAAPTMQRAGDLQRYNTTLENAALMADAGIPVAITSGYESYVPKTRVILFEAGVAAANGLGWERALASVTSVPAGILGVGDEVGSLAAGRRADLVLYDGDPLEYASHVDAVYVGGRLAYRR